MVKSSLQNPWDLAFTSEGVMLYTEKCLGLSAVLTNGTTVRLFGTTGSSLVASDLFCEGQSGALGVAVDPNFAGGSRFVYVFMASNLQTNPRTNRVVRLTLSSDSRSVSSRVDIISNIAYKDVANAVGGPGVHSGGRIRFGPDGYLYVTSGDNHNPTLPQDLSRLGGKVLRVDRNGAPAAETTRLLAEIRASIPMGIEMCRASLSDPEPDNHSPLSMVRITRTKSLHLSPAAMADGIRKTAPA